MPTLFHKTCPVCSVNFSVVPRYKKKIFCSITCHFEHKSRTAINPKQKKCLNCQSDIKTKHAKKFCCQGCSATYNNKHRDPECNERQKQTLMATLVSQGLAKTDAKEIYKSDCSFRFNVFDYPNLQGYELLQLKGLYHPESNPTGVVRDHIMSREYGWRNNIPSHILAHPANCQIIGNAENLRKGAQSHITYDELLNRIELWNQQNGTFLPIINSPGPKQVKAKSKVRQHRHEIYKWTLQHIHTQEIVEVTQIAKWLKQNGYATGEVYGKHSVWNIIEKYNLRTGIQLI